MNIDEILNTWADRTNLAYDRRNNNPPQNYSPVVSVRFIDGARAHVEVAYADGSGASWFLTSDDRGGIGVSLDEAVRQIVAVALVAAGLAVTLNAMERASS